jgi:hypothetical protein
MVNEVNEHEYGDFIIYGDETGDHSMGTVYKQHPIFALVLCIFSKNDYVVNVTRHIKKLKFTFWGHDATILHSAKLRRQIEDFQFLQNPKRREFFIETLNAAIQNSPFTIISTGIDKRLLNQQYDKPENLYELSLEYCLERIYRFLQEKEQFRKTTYIILESRGNTVDRTLEAAFGRILIKNQVLQAQYPLKILFVDKKANSIGLQIADLVAYPIGRFVVDPLRENRSFDIFRDKFHKYPNYLGKGLKIFPTKTLMIEPEKRKASEYSEA